MKLQVTEDECILTTQGLDSKLTDKEQRELVKLANRIRSRIISEHSTFLFWRNKQEKRKP